MNRQRLRYLIPVLCILVVSIIALTNPAYTSPTLAQAEPSGTPTDTATPTLTFTPTDTATPTLTFTPTDTATSTATATASFTPTDTATSTASFTPTDTPTNTAPPASSTPSNTPTNTAVAASSTPSNTPTNTAPPPSSTPSSTPTNTATPTPSTGTVVRQINDRRDDVNEEGSSFTAFNTSIWIGNGNGPSFTGLRFNNLAIPRGATITSAYLSFYTTSSQWIRVSLQIAGDAADNSPTFSSTNRPSARVLTAARVNHRSDLFWGANNWYNFNDMSGVVQEIVNRPGWQSGNSLSIILRGTGSTWGRKFVRAFESGASTAVKLTVTYRLP